MKTRSKVTSWLTRILVFAPLLALAFMFNPVATIIIAFLMKFSWVMIGAKTPLVELGGYGSAIDAEQSLKYKQSHDQIIRRALREQKVDLEKLESISVLPYGIKSALYAPVYLGVKEKRLYVTEAYLDAGERALHLAVVSAVKDRREGSKTDWLFALFYSLPLALVRFGFLAYIAANNGFSVAMYEPSFMQSLLLMIASVFIAHALAQTIFILGDSFNARIDKSFPLEDQKILLKTYSTILEKGLRAENGEVSLSTVDRSAKRQLEERVNALKRRLGN